MNRKKQPVREFLPASISSLLLVTQIITGLYLLPSVDQITILAYIGVGLYIGSGWIFGMLPVFEFKKHGGVKKGDSYIHTSHLVDTGVYSIVRHPQYVTFILFGIAGMLLFQRYIPILLGIPIIPFTYIDLIQADKQGIKKFDIEYKKYMKKVPRANFLLGIILYIKRKFK